MEERNEPQEIVRLKAHLQGEALPGWEAQRLACPPGRPLDVEAKVAMAKRAGVMCLLCPDEDQQWCVVLMRRTEDGQAHSGQLAFPGGAEDHEDEGDLRRTAIRECAEEVGVHVPDHRVLGLLSSLYIPPSDFFVQPVVGWSAKPLEFVLQEEEVAEVLVLPMESLPAPFEAWPTQRVAVRGGFARVPGWLCEGQVLWGATAMMVAELRAVCELAGFGPSFVST